MRRAACLELSCRMVRVCCARWGSYGGYQKVIWQQIEGTPEPDEHRPRPAAQVRSGSGGSVTMEWITARANTLSCHRQSLNTSSNSPENLGAAR